MEALSMGIADTVSLSSQWVPETNDQHRAQPQPAQAMSCSESCLIFLGNTVNQQTVNPTSVLRHKGEVNGSHIAQHRAKFSSLVRQRLLLARQDRIVDGFLRPSYLRFLITSTYHGPDFYLESLVSGLACSSSLSTGEGKACPMTSLITPVEWAAG
jgi:hypothetical protein